VILEREESLQQLLALAEQAKQGRGGLALVSGEAGIGKTSLLQLFRSKLIQSQRVLWGGSDALFTPRPLGPLHDMAPSLNPKIRHLLTEGAQPTTLYTLMLQELESSSPGTILIFEDSHWADYATLDLLKFLGRRISMLPALLVISFRDDEVNGDHPLARVIGELPTAHTTRINLKPLSKEAIKILGLPPGYEIDDLYDITGGNPFFVSELLSCQHNPESHIPASIKDAVNARLVRLSSEERSLLETISVIPGAVPLKLLDTLVGSSGETLAMACIGRNILVQESSEHLRFRHELSRLATLARVPMTQQKDLHAKVLETLLLENQSLHNQSLKPGEQKESIENYSNLDQMVHHAAGAFDSKHVLEFAPTAARTAAALGAHSEAADHLATALRFVNNAEPELAAQLYENWAYEAGLALRIDDDVLEARRHAISLWRALDRPEKVGENLRWMSRLHWYRGEASEANHFADEAIQVLESTPQSAEHAMAYSLRSQLHMLNDRMDDAILWGEKALELAKKYNNVEVEIHALNNIGSALVFRNNPDGIEKLERSLALALQEGLHEHAARVYTNLSEYAVYFRNFELAEEVLAKGIAYNNQHDLFAWRNYLLGRLALLRLDQGRLRDAQTIAAGVLKTERLTLLMRLPAISVLAQTQMRLGEQSAYKNFADALTDALATDELQYIIPIRLGLIEFAWLNNQTQNAIEHLEYLNALGPEAMHLWRVGETVVWAHRLSFSLNKDFYKDFPEPHQLEMKEDFFAAAKLWESLGLPYAAALTLMQTTNKDHIQNAFIAAQDLLEPIDANGGITKLKSLAADFSISELLHSKRRGPYKAARNHPLGLTKREQEILRLISKGATNKEIASTLSRSQRTIEHHVSAILTKLNSNSRMEAMLRVHNEPWLLPE